MTGESGDTKGAAAVVRRCFDVWQRGDLDGLLALYDADVELDATAFGEGVYRGHAEVRRFLESIVATTAGSALQFEDLRLHEVDDGRIAVGATAVGTGAGSGVQISAPVGFVYELTGGLVARLVYFRDPEDALVAVGLSA